MLTQAQLHELLNYNPDTGVFTWKKRTSNRAPIGSVAGTLSNGYWGITIAGMRTYAHRLAFLYMEGDYPLAQVVDHIDGDKLNNKWTNLRRFSRNLNNSEVGIIERLDRRRVHSWAAPVRPTLGDPP